MFSFSDKIILNYSFVSLIVGRLSRKKFNEIFMDFIY